MTMTMTITITITITITNQYYPLINTRPRPSLSLFETPDREGPHFGHSASIILILRGGILMSMEDFLEILSQRILVGMILVGRLGAMTRAAAVQSAARDSVGPPSLRAMHSRAAIPQTLAR